MRGVRTAAMALGLAMVVSVIGVGGVAAGPLLNEPFTDEFEFTDVDFCDVDGLTVDVDAVAEGRILFVAKGKDKLPYFKVNFTRTAVLTNRDDPTRYLVETVRVVDKDLKVTDNGNGTSTILVLATGNGVLATPEGTVIARNPGQIRFEILVDNAGTPQDPFDDEIIAQGDLIKGSTGRSDDFCGAAVPALTG